MKLILLLLTTSALVLWVSLAPAQAENPAEHQDFRLSFDLPKPSVPPSPADLPPDPINAPGSAPEVDAAHRPLPIPAHGTRPPMRFHSPSQLPSGVNRQVVAVALNEGHQARDLLPPAPPRLGPVPTPSEGRAVAVAPDPTDAVDTDRPGAAAKGTEGADAVVLNFGLWDHPALADIATPAAQVDPAPNLAPNLAPNPASLTSAQVLPTLFEGGSQSLVARAVGSAEGTRTATGGITTAYHGHTDPGNRAWNMGTFSYQHGAASAEEADRKQLKRLQSQTKVLERRALNRGMGLTLEETLNGIDLANQSPLAAIGRVGYIERLAEVKTWGLDGREAIVVARTRSYINPNTGRWNAPGLGNTEVGITRDQRRRTEAIARALEAYRLEYPDLHLSPTLITIASPAVIAALQPPAPPEPPLPPPPDPVPLRLFLDNLPTSPVTATVLDSSEQPASEHPGESTQATEEDAPQPISIHQGTVQPVVPSNRLHQGSLFPNAAQVAPQNTVQPDSGAITSGNQEAGNQATADDLPTPVPTRSEPVAPTQGSQ